MAKVISIQTDDQLVDLINNSESKKLNILFFYAKWANPCTQMAQVFKTLAESHPEISFLSIDAESLSSVSDLFEVETVPSFILIQNSTILKEITGSDPKEISNAIADFKDGKLDLSESEPKEASAAPEKSTTQEPTPTTTEAALAPEPEETEEELNERLTKLTKAAPIMVFIKGTPSEPKCGFSRQLIAILREHQVKFGFFNILKDDSVRQGLKAFSDWPTFPQVYINGEFQGGLDIIKENLEEDENFFENALEEQ